MTIPSIRKISRCLIAGFLLLAVSAVAQDEAQIEAFNEAILLHKDARLGTDVLYKVDTALEVLEIGQSFIPGNDERLAMLMHNYGTALYEAGRPYEARKVLLEALEILEENQGKHSLELLDTIKAAADAWGGLPVHGRRHLAGYKPALKIIARHYGKDSVEYADLLMEAGARVYDLSQSDAGHHHFRTALKIYKARLPAPDIRTGAALFYLAKIRMSRNSNEAAVAYLEEALPHFGDDSSIARMNRLRARVLIVQALDGWGRSEQADEYAREIGREAQFDVNQDPVLLVAANPEYPYLYLDRGIEGYVDVEYSIDHEGRVVNSVVIDKDYRFSIHATRSGHMPTNAELRRPGNKSLEEAALEAIALYRYAPKYVNGDPVFVHGVTQRITFEIK